jgi:hypothetical protein
VTRGRLHVAIAAAAIVVNAGAATAAAVFASPPAVASAPSECHHPTLPSGDAVSVNARGDADTPPDQPGAAEFVCTDGQWVPVQHYGNS